MLAVTLAGAAQPASYVRRDRSAARALPRRAPLLARATTASRWPPRCAKTSPIASGGQRPARRRLVAAPGSAAPVAVAAAAAGRLAAPRHVEAAVPEGALEVATSRPASSSAAVISSRVKRPSSWRSTKCSGCPPPPRPGSGCRGSTGGPRAAAGTSRRVSSRARLEVGGQVAVPEGLGGEPGLDDQHPRRAQVGGHPLQRAAHRVRGADVADRAEEAGDHVEGAIELEAGHVALVHRRRRGSGRGPPRAGAD